MRIESYRTRLEEFEHTLNRELYRYYSGQKSSLEILPVYAEYSDLFSVESIREAESELKNTNTVFPSRRRSIERILDFLMDQHIDSGAAPLTQEIATFDTKHTLFWEGSEIPLFKVPAAIKNEPDSIKRRELNGRNASVCNESGLMLNRIAHLQSAASRLGFKSYTEIRTRISGIDYSVLLNSLNPILSRLEGLYLERFRVSFEATLGIPFRAAGSWDVPYWLMKKDQEPVFLKQNLLSVLKATVSELGIEPEQSDRIVLDLDQKVLKQSKPFCIPIRIPHEIKISMLPENGSKQYAALLHESGHAHHFAWTSPSLPVEYRIWGDRALSESYAFLLESLILDPQWLARTFSFTKSEEFLRFQFLFRMFLIRRCSGRLCCALRLHEQRSLEAMPQTYAQTMKSYTGLGHQPELWLDDIADGFECADYLRGWILGSMLKEYLRSKYGNAWFWNRSAGRFLKEIWETGQLYRADELCREIGIGDLDLQALADELSKGLRE
jgi:hypothetical protein